MGAIVAIGGGDVVLATQPIDIEIIRLSGKLRLRLRRCGWLGIFLYSCARYRDPPPCEHDDLIVQVDRLQVARLTTTIKELRKQLVSGQAPGGAILQG